MHVDEVIAELAAPQLGLVTRPQLHAAGITKREIETRIATGRLRRVRRGVYAVGGASLPPNARYLSATLTCGAGAVVSHNSGAEVWAYLPRSKRDVDVTIAGRRGLRVDGVVIHRPRALDPRDVTRINGVPVTGAARTLLDLAEVAEFRDLERAWSEAQARHLISARKIRALLERSPGRRGRPLIEELLARAGGPMLSRSELEELMLGLIRSARLPLPDMNVLVLGRYRVDFLWREQSLIAETDGGGWHASKERRDRDHRRDSDLRNAGWNVERFTDREVDREPHAVVARLTRALYSGR